MKRVKIEVPINLCNFAAQQEGISPRLKNWLYVLKNMQFFDEGDYEKQSGIFKDLLDECRISKMNEMEKKDYDKSVLEYEGVREAVAFAKELAAEEAFGKGMEKGMEKGIEKGRAEGMEKGMEKATILIAQNMIRNGLDVSTIVAATGLTEQKVLQLTV